MSNSLEVSKQADHELFTLQIRPDGIMHIAMKPEVTLKQSDAEAMVRLFREMGGGKKFLLLFTAGKDTTVSTDARYYASGPEANQYTIASAFVVKSVAQKLLGNAYVTFNKPITPTRIFTEEADAVKWLENFRNK